MKRKREHEVPLSAAAMAIIKRLEPARIGKFVFAGRWNVKPIAHWAMWNLVQHLTGRQDGEPIAASQASGHRSGRGPPPRKSPERSLGVASLVSARTRPNRL